MKRRKFKGIAKVMKYKGLGYFFFLFYFTVIFTIQNVTHIQQYFIYIMPIWLLGENRWPAISDCLGICVSCICLYYFNQYISSLFCCNLLVSQLLCFHETPSCSFILWISFHLRICFFLYYENQGPCERVFNIKVVIRANCSRKVMRYIG
jgi:hypothetical protein